MRMLSENAVTKDDLNKVAAGAANATTLLETELNKLKKQLKFFMIKQAVINILLVVLIFLARG